jgi:8-oxo-dGTP pyrophosphatase MutT (NUDIX family)
MDAHVSKPQQAAAIPIRRRGSNLQVCLIRKRLSGTWGIPKGTVDAGHTHATTALKEAWEEAGLRGRLVGDSLGTYRYEKFGRPLVVMVYAMEVLEHHDDWQEAGLRERKWASFEEAGSLLVEHPAQAFLGRALRLFSVDA